MQIRPVEESIGRIPVSPVTLDRIPGMESAKRCLEVALAGSLSMVFVYNSNSAAVEILRAGRRIAGKHGLPFHGLAYPACPCGNYASTTNDCQCRPSVLRRHLSRLLPRRQEFDIWMDACQAKPAGIDVSKGDTENDVARRVLAARAIANAHAPPDGSSIELLKAYQKHLGATLDTDRILRAVRAIAALDGKSSQLEPHHTAEAIQYQAASLSWVWQLTGLEKMEVTTERKVKSVFAKDIGRSHSRALPHGQAAETADDKARG